MAPGWNRLRRGRGRSSSGTTAATSATCCSQPATSSRASSRPRRCSTTGSPPQGTASTSSLVPAFRTSTSRAGRSRSASSSTPGRVYASSLREGWSTPRKAIYALASPLIPLVRFGRSLRLIRRPSHRDIVPTAVIPALALGILCDGAGQVMGHIAGVGRSEEELSGYEYRRVDNVTAGDRRAIEALTASLRSSDV